MLKRIHTLTIKVRFDKKCTKATALYNVRDTIHGTFYPYAPEDHLPEIMTVKSFK